MSERKRHIAILGSTGSIGTQTLDVIRQHPERFEVELLTANTSSERLIAQAREFHPAHVVIRSAEKYREVADALADEDITVYCGMDSICSLVSAEQVDMVVAAMVGFSGLKPTLAAIRAGKAIALANKETLVAAGSLVTRLASENRVAILPVDSEHSAIFQCLLGAGTNRPCRLHLTASGGPFRTWPRERIAKATAAEALKHPNWDMGAKITIDSATMMNKGFEVIEASWLFGMDPKDIRVLVHPESVIHSMVEFSDGAVLAQLGCPDMRVPIEVAISYPERLPLDGPRLDLAATRSLTFEEADPERFPCLALAFDAIRRGGNVPCAMNAANEAAVKAFLQGRIGFYAIADTVADAMDAVGFIPEPTLDDIFETNREAYDRACRKTGLPL